MIDINLIRTNPEKVKENIKKKFQNHKLHLVDEVLEWDKKVRQLKQEGDDLRSKRNVLSGQIGSLMKNFGHKSWRRPFSPSGRSLRRSPNGRIL